MTGTVDANSSAPSFLIISPMFPPSKLTGFAEEEEEEADDSDVEHNQLAALRVGSQGQFVKVLN